MALEDALSKGLPIKAEIEALRTYLDGIDRDSVLDLVLSSLPEETIDRGTNTVLQLNEQASFCFPNLCFWVYEPAHNHLRVMS